MFRRSARYDEPFDISAGTAFKYPARGSFYQRNTRSNIPLPFRSLREMAQVLEKIRRAVLDGAESQAYSGSQGRYLMAGGRRTKLIEASGKVTAAGRAYYQEVLGIAPPRLFASRLLRSWDAVFCWGFKDFLKSLS